MMCHSLTGFRKSVLPERGLLILGLYSTTDKKAVEVLIINAVTGVGQAVMVSRVTPGVI